MYNLFTKRFDSANSVIKPSGFELVRRTYQRELATIVEYFNTRVHAVQSNHLLCRMLITGYSASDYSLSRFLEVTYARSPYVAKYFNITDDISYGKLFDGVFYGQGCTEILLYNEDYFDPFNSLNKWKSLKPVTVLEHPISDFSLLLPDGKDKNTAKGLCVISINLPMLMFMYRQFLEEQRFKDKESVLGASHFVHMFVLPGMLYSHIEIVLLNRMKNLFYAAPMSQSLKKHPFPIVDYSDKVDRISDDVLEHLFDTSRQYYQYLKSIPSFFDEDMQESMLMPDIARTRQVWWSLLLSRLGTIKFLIDLGSKKGLAANTSLLNKLKLDIKQIKRENVLSNVLPDDMLYEVLVLFEEIEALI